MPIFYWVIALGGVRRVMRDASLFDAHVEAGGAKASSWGVAAAIVGALLVFVLTATLAGLE